MRETSLHCMELAKNNNTKIVIDLADPGVIQRNLEDLKQIAQKYADIILANDDEARAFTNLEPEQALHEIAKLADIAIVKLGEHGSIIKHNNTITRIEAIKTTPIDTTGAGDSFAAGFLYCLANNYSIEKAGKLGSYIASEVIQKLGARVDNINKEEVNKILNA